MAINTRIQMRQITEGCQTSLNTRIFHSASMPYIRILTLIICNQGTLYRPEIDLPSCAILLYNTHIQLYIHCQGPYGALTSFLRTVRNRRSCICFRTCLMSQAHCACLNCDLNQRVPHVAKCYMCRAVKTVESIYSHWTLILHLSVLLRYADTSIEL